jgi:hypothetical protein
MRHASVHPEYGEAILFWVASMPFDLLLPRKQKLGVLNPGGKPPPSPYTCMFHLRLQGPESRHFTELWSNTVVFNLIVFFTVDSYRNI